MQKRNVGIEGLRLFSMYLIVILHILGAGGILEEVSPFSSAYVGSWFVEMVALCAVNCYCLISGYVGGKTPAKISRLLQLWFQVVFYTLLITSFFACFTGISVTRRDWMNAILPITTGQYWYLSCYFGMFFFLPVMQKGVEYLEKKQLIMCLLGLFLLYTILPVALNQDPFAVKSGYSVVWMLILYLFGAYLKNSDVISHTSRKFGAFLVAFGVLLSWGGRMVVEFGTLHLLGEIKYGYVLASYISPFVVMASVGFLILFADRRTSDEDGIKEQEHVKLTRTKKWICSTGKASLGVYLIHAQPLIFTNCLTGNAAFLAKESVAIELLAVLLIAAVIWFCCLIVDMLRIQIFKWLRISQLCEAIERKITTWK